MVGRIGPDNKPPRNGEAGSTLPKQKNRTSFWDCAVDFFVLATKTVLRNNGAIIDDSFGDYKVYFHEDKNIIVMIKLNTLVEDCNTPLPGSEEESQALLS